MANKSKTGRFTVRRKAAAGLIAGAALVSGVGTSVALASTPDSGVIHACYARSNGSVRIVKTATTCPSGQTAISWSQTGPQGSSGEKGNKGAEGAQGTQGAAGAQGIAGSNGSLGVQGPAGPQGAAGAPGIGAPGSQGAQGPQGNQGFQGTQGPQGNQGATGPDLQAWDSNDVDLGTVIGEQDNVVDLLTSTGYEVDFQYNASSGDPYQTIEYQLYGCPSYGGSYVQDDYEAGVGRTGDYMNPMQVFWTNTGFAVPLNSASVSIPQYDAVYVNGTCTGGYVGTTTYGWQLAAVSNAQIGLPNTLGTGQIVISATDPI